MVHKRLATRMPQLSKFSSAQMNSMSVAPWPRAAIQLQFLRRERFFFNESVNIEGWGTSTLQSERQDSSNEGARGRPALLGVASGGWVGKYAPASWRRVVVLSRTSFGELVVDFKRPAGSCPWGTGGRILEGMRVVQVGRTL